MIQNGRGLPALSGKIPYAIMAEEYHYPDGIPFEIESTVYWEYFKYPHALFIGATGTGKTTALKFLMVQFFINVHDCEIFLSTFKHPSEDFLSFKEGVHFSSYRNCKRMFDTFYSRFESRLEGRDTARSLLLLIFDEWVGFLLSLDKKEQEDVLAKMGQLLMMGRSMNVQVVVAMQRPDANFFKNGARDNFNLIVALGNLSSDGYRMVFPSDFMNKTTPCRRIGQGHSLIGGAEFHSIRIPLLSPFGDTILNNRFQGS